MPSHEKQDDAQPTTLAGELLVPVMVLLAVVLLCILVTLWRNPMSRGGFEPQAIGYRINVNTADTAELCLLPRVGPSIAHYIIDRRTQQPLHSREDLLEVRYVGEKTLRHFEDYVAFE